MECEIKYWSYSATTDNRFFCLCFLSLRSGSNSANASRDPSERWPDSIALEDRRYDDDDDEFIRPWLPAPLAPPRRRRGLARERTRPARFLGSIRRKKVVHPLVHERSNNNSSSSPVNNRTCGVERGIKCTWRPTTPSVRADRVTLLQRELKANRLSFLLPLPSRPSAPTSLTWLCNWAVGRNAVAQSAPLASIIEWKATPTGSLVRVQLEFNLTQCKFLMSFILLYVSTNSFGRNSKLGRHFHRRPAAIDVLWSASESTNEFNQCRHGGVLCRHVGCVWSITDAWTREPCRQHQQTSTPSDARRSDYYLSARLGQ